MTISGDDQGKQKVSILILPNHQLLFPLQTIHKLELSPSNSTRFKKLIEQHQRDPIYLGCLPASPSSAPSDQPSHFDWGCLAKLISIHPTTNNKSSNNNNNNNNTTTTSSNIPEILRLDLLGIHRFKIHNHHLPSDLDLPTPLSSLPPQLSISIHPEVNDLNPSSSQADLHLIHDFNRTIHRFIHLLSTLDHHPPPQANPLSTSDPSINDLNPQQISFLIDLMIRDLQLIPWSDKLRFLTYYRAKSKLNHFIQLISRISHQIQSIDLSSSPTSPSPFPSIDLPRQANHLKKSELKLNPQQLQALLPYRLKLINLQLNRALNHSHLNPLTRPHQPLRFLIQPNGSNPTPIIITTRRVPNLMDESRKPVWSSSSLLPPPPPPPSSSDPDVGDDDLKRLRKEIHSAGMTKEAFEICTKELKRLSTIPPSSVEHGVIRNYLDVMLEFPWSKTTIDSTRQVVLSKSFLQDARQQLDLDHFGMIKLKQRLIEFLAVIKLRTQLENPSIHPSSHPSHSKNNPSDGPKTLDEAKINRLWKDKIDPAFLVHSNHQPNTNTHGSHLPPSDPTPNVSTPNKRAPILLLVGPPGVGKTSIARSIAKALHKKFYRISLGGVKDESEIRGHRRTYVGSMPGTIVQALRRVGVNDPVILLDEIDKVGNRSFNGDPASALLEVLDPEQNSTFVDHYINTPVDLSSVLFIATANETSTISMPLLDRLEVLNVDGYLLNEKLEIAKRNLLPKQIENYSLKPHQLTLEDPDRILKKIILGYTNESGVRNLEREIGNLCRAKVLEFVESRDKSDHGQTMKSDDFDRFSAKITFGDLPKILGPERYEAEASELKLTPGVAIGLAYQGSGNGSILYIEATSYPGNGSLKLTGSLGAVIKESAELAISWIKTHSHLMNLKMKDFDKIDLHIHFPSGSVKKDGPSAGLALVLALVSLLSDLPIDHRLAVTGEISLRGQVLPVGGIREKVLAANRSGIKEIILPFKNMKEIKADPHLNGIEESSMRIRYVNSLYELIKLVFKETLWKDRLEGLNKKKNQDDDLHQQRHKNNKQDSSSESSVLLDHHQNPSSLPFPDLHNLPSLNPRSLPNSFDTFIKLNIDSLL